MRRLAVALSLLAASPAQAATVSTRVDVSDQGHQAITRFVTWEVTDRAGAGNRLAVRAIPGGIEVTDAHRLRAGRACRRVTVRLVRCRTPSRRSTTTVTGLHVRAGAGSDEVSIAGLSGAVYGQAGDDRIDATAAGGGVRLHGGAGADQVAGGPFDDILQGDSGADVLHGGPGRDLARWPRRRAVHASLATGRALSAGETDELSRIEDLASGGGADVLEGDAGPNVLAGGQGADRLLGGDGDDALSGDYQDGRLEQRAHPDLLDGGDGDDELAGRGGGDTYAGGPGDDELLAGATLAPAREAPDPATERMRCDEGTDTVREPDAADLVEPDCELVDWSGGGVRAPSFSVPAPVVTDDWALRGVLRCDGELAESCPTRVVLADGPRVLGSLETRLAGDEEQPFTLTLTPEGREQIRRRGCLLARLTITIGDSVHGDVAHAVTLRLSAPG